MMLEKNIPTAEAMEALGASLVSHVQGLHLVGLRGELGAGKTTLVRGMLRALGHVGPVKSPTFTLVEHYALATRTVHHIDLYRVKDPEELEFLGMRDYLDGRSTCLVEWPERGTGILPETDIDVIIRLANHGRTVQIVSHTASGAAVMDGLS